jgi:hypothetical protein
MLSIKLGYLIVKVGTCKSKIAEVRTTTHAVKIADASPIFTPVIPIFFATNAITLVKKLIIHNTTTLQ